MTHTMTHTEIDKRNLIESSINLVTELLLEQDEYYPLAFVVDLNGKVENITYFDGDENPKSEELMFKFLDIFQDKGDKGEIRACALAYDARVKRDSESDTVDAIAIKIIHLEKIEIITYFYSYKKVDGHKIEILENWNDFDK